MTIVFAFVLNNGEWIAGFGVHVVRGGGKSTESRWDFNGDMICNFFCVLICVSCGSASKFGRALMAHRNVFNQFLTKTK